jgi:hypothetical protein
MKRCRGRVYTKVKGPSQYESWYIQANKINHPTFIILSINDVSCFIHKEWRILTKIS